MASLAGTFGEWLRRRRDIQAHQALDDRMLADMGISRSAIAAYVHGIDRRPR